MELAIVIIVLALAAALAGWRVWRTLRVSQGKGEAHACGKCPANQS
jgi:predicted negative regulator of RcsB-dependent stress response